MRGHIRHSRGSSSNASPLPETNNLVAHALALLPSPSPDALPPIPLSLMDQITQTPTLPLALSNQFPFCFLPRISNLLEMIKTARSLPL